MITIIAECSVKPGKKTEFLAAASQLIAESRKEAGNGSYNLFQSLSDENKLTFIENWRDQQAIDEHNNSAHFQAAGRIFGTLLAGDLVINLYKNTDL